MLNHVFSYTEVAFNTNFASQTIFLNTINNFMLSVNRPPKPSSGHKNLTLDPTAFLKPQANSNLAQTASTNLGSSLSSSSVGLQMDGSPAVIDTPTPENVSPTIDGLNQFGPLSTGESYYWTKYKKSES